MSPHDALFKSVYREPAHARGALRSALPALLSDAIDWPSLARCPGSFVDPGLRERHTDLLFSADWRDRDLSPIFLLYEHQSSSDGQMAFRLLRYKIRIWEQWLDKHPDRDLLPVIIAVVLHHGASPWPASLSFDAKLDLPADLRARLDPLLVRFAYLVDDLADTSDAQLQQRAMTALGKLAAACFKHARTHPDPVALLRAWVIPLREVIGAPRGEESLRRVLRYLHEVCGPFDQHALAAFLEQEVSPRAKEIAMTMKEYLIEQGVQRGLQQGIRQGMQRGKRDLLMSLLRRRFGDVVSAETEHRLAEASVEQLDSWSNQLFSANTLDELLA